MVIKRQIFAWDAYTCVCVCLCVEQIDFVLFHTKLSKKMTSSHSYGVILGRKTFSCPHCTEANGLNYTSNPGITQRFLG